MNLANVEIKLLIDCQKHIPALAVLWYEEISKQWVPNSSIDRATQNLIQHSNREEMPLTFVALYQDQPVGMASLREDDGIGNNFTPWLGTLIVHPNYRRYGIGNKLIECVKDQAKLFGHDELYLLAFDQTIPAWYSRLGWTSIGQDQLFGHPIALMKIDLAN